MEYFRLAIFNFVSSDDIISIFVFNELPNKWLALIFSDFMIIIPGNICEGSKYPSLSLVISDFEYSKGVDLVFTCRKPRVNLAISHRMSIYKFGLLVELLKLM